MAIRRTTHYTRALLVAACFVFTATYSVGALPSTSPNFEISEPEFGAGASLESCSGTYCAQASIGDMSAGETVRAAETAAFAAITKDSGPLLEVIIAPGASDLGVLSTDTTASKSTVVKIRTYESSGYTLQIVGNPPSYEGHMLRTSAVRAVSQPGTEQFGINAVANTAPAIGADPKQHPDGTFSVGYVQPEYAVQNQYKYENGGVIARSDSESGQTEYTISMIINIAGSTPAGHFTTDFAAVVIPIF